MARLYLLLGYLLLGGSAYAEDFLITPDGKYLGIKSGTQFKTCEEAVFEIGKNKVMPTDQKCKKIGAPKAAESEKKSQKGDRDA